MEGSQPSAPAGEVKQPVVFQCDKCLAIVGDSLAWVQADESVGTITLSAMRGVVCKEDSLQTSKAGKDIGCTFVPVNCKGCNVALGKMYKTTSRAFDPIRDYFTIKTSNLRGYELGKYDTEAVPVSAASGEPAPSVDALQEKIWRMEQLLLLFNERFERIEALIGPAPDADAAAKDRDDARRKLQRTSLK